MEFNNSCSLLCSHSAEVDLANVSKSSLSCQFPWSIVIPHLSWPLNSIEMMDYFLLLESLSSLGFLHTPLSWFSLSFIAFLFPFFLLATLLFLNLCTLPNLLSSGYFIQHHDKSVSDLYHQPQLFPWAKLLLFYLTVSW